MDRVARTSVDARRVLLIETLDAAGGSPADALVRLETAKRAGFDSVACVYDARPAALRGDDEPFEPRGIEMLRSPADLLDRLAEARDRLVIVASSSPGGGEVARLVPAGMSARWWPTGVPAAPPPALGFRKTCELEAVDACIEAGPGPSTCASAGLNWSVIEDEIAGRRRLAPWDGEYLLVPVPITARAGKPLLRAFATIAEEHDALDLVFLAPPAAEMIREARRIGVGTRVHFAGCAPRLAEYAWCHSASAVLLSASMPLSGGVVLRALAASAPVLAFGVEPADRVVRAWLEQAGCVLTMPGHAPADLCHVLGRVLERGPQVTHAIARGLATAGLHHIDALSPRLRVALRLDAEQRRRAA